MAKAQFFRAVAEDGDTPLNFDELREALRRVKRGDLERKIGSRTVIASVVCDDGFVFSDLRRGRQNFENLGKRTREKLSPESKALEEQTHLHWRDDVVVSTRTRDSPWPTLFPEYVGLILPDSPKFRLSQLLTVDAHDALQDEGEFTAAEFTFSTTNLTGAQGDILKEFHLNALAEQLGGTKIKLVATTRGGDRLDSSVVRLFRFLSRGGRGRKANADAKLKRGRGPTGSTVALREHTLSADIELPREDEHLFPESRSQAIIKQLRRVCDEHRTTIKRSGTID
jgi:hypothetical protein